MADEFDDDYEHDPLDELDALDEYEDYEADTSNTDNLESTDDKAEEFNGRGSFEHLKLHDAGDENEELAKLKRNISEGVNKSLNLPNIADNTHADSNVTNSGSQSSHSTSSSKREVNNQEDVQVHKRKSPKRKKEQPPRISAEEMEEFTELDKEITEQMASEPRPLSEETNSKRKKRRPRRETPSNNEDAETIKKLKEANQSLKNQLIELNAALDRQLAQKGIQFVKPKQTNASSAVSEQELKNLHQQIAVLKKANEELKLKLETGGGSSERVVSLENKVLAKNKLIQELREENKSLKNVEREQSKALESLSGDQEKAVNQLKSDVQFHKDKMKKLKEAYEKAKNILDQKSKMLEHTEAKLRHLNDVLKQANLTKGGIIESKKLEQELEAKTKQVEDLEKKLAISLSASESLKKNSAVTISQLKQQIKKLEDNIEDHKSAFEEKDKQFRAAVIQIKDNGNTNAPSKAKTPSASPSSQQQKVTKPQSSSSEKKQPQAASKNTKPAESKKPATKPANNSKPVQKALNGGSKLPVMKKRISDSDQNQSPDVQKVEEEQLQEAEKPSSSDSASNETDQQQTFLTQEENTEQDEFEQLDDFEEEFGEIEEETKTEEEKPQQNSIFAPDF